MEHPLEAAQAADIVHPEIRAHINSLVSALGGFSADDDGRYVLGDSALDVLRDIKKFIRFNDDKHNRMDVARCLAEANVVTGDLLHIIADWPMSATESKYKERIALACVEILVPLTWPLDRAKDEMTVNHHRHVPVLQLAQVDYKRAIIHFDKVPILRTATLLALPPMALARNERSSRDEGIIKLMLYLIRNIIMIHSPNEGKQDSGDEFQISRSTLIDTLTFQDIILTILTIASNMGEDFDQEGVIVLEIIFHLVKRVDVNKLYMTEKQVNRAMESELESLLAKEAALRRPHNGKASTRHNRWGAMVWVKRDDGKMSTVSGQDTLLDASKRQEKMDSTKVFKRPRQARKEEMEPKDLGPPVTLNARAKEQLRDFVNEFLDSGFNPLFQRVRRQLDEQKSYVLGYHQRQLFYLVSWFLQAERARKKAAKTKSSTTETEDEDGVGEFNLVASVLNQETFISLNRSIGRALEDKDWQELNAAMRCFTQILLTVQEMFGSQNEADQEIAENILSRIFYEEETHERVATIARTYKDQGFEYLDACTELTHTYLRILEAYSKQNVDMQVRSRRRVRKKKKKTGKARIGDDDGDGNPVAVEEEDSEAEQDQASAEKESRERKFDFGRFANRFVTQGVVDTFVKFTRYYQDLDETQLKRAHRYFYCCAFKQNMSVMLFRVDIVQLLHSMIKGSHALDKNSCSSYKEWEELCKQILKKCIRKIEERPALIIEMLFSKVNATAHYLEYGYEKQTARSTNPRPAAELGFKAVGLDNERKIAVAVGVLLDKGFADHVAWVKDQLGKAAVERRAWERLEVARVAAEGGGREGGDGGAQQENGTGAISEARPGQENATNETSENATTANAPEAPIFTIEPDDDTRKKAIFKNPHLRLLLSLVSIQCLAPLLDETPDATYIIPSHISVPALQTSLDHISKAEFAPPTFEDGRLAENQLRRKSAPRRKAAFDDDDGDALSEDGEEEFLFAPGGPTHRKDDHAKPKHKLTRRKRRASDAEGAGTDDKAKEEERRRKKKERELEKMRKLKSEVWVHASDDDTDEERDRGFFENEEKIRRRQREGALDGLLGGAVGRDKDEEVLVVEEEEEGAGEKGRKRGFWDTSDEEDEDEDGTTAVARKTGKKVVDVEEDSEDQGSDGGSDSASDDALLSATRPPDLKSKGKGGKRRKVSPLPLDGDGEDDSDEEMADASVPARSISRTEKNGKGDEDDGDKENRESGEDDEDEDEAPVAKPARRRPRTMAGFVVDSSDEE